MAYRLVALDLDGTLLDRNHRISPANADAIQECLDRGIQIVLATGRLFASIVGYCQSMRLAGPHITLNGAVIADTATGALDSLDSMTAEDMRFAAQALEAEGLEYVVFGRRSIYTRSFGPLCDLLVGYGEPEPIIVSSLDEHSVPDPVKVLAFLGEDVASIVATAKAGCRLDAVRTGPHFLEFLVPGATKGKALSRLISQSGVMREEVIAIGDGHNDVSMFSVAGLGVAMANAPVSVQEQAGAITGHFAEDGVASALWRFVLGT